jgi:lysozyme family protein
MTDTARYDRAFKEVVGYEGGYVDDPNDHGGKTKYGISQKTYPNLDIANLTLDQAKAIYWRDFYRALSLNALENEQVALEIFDTAVNCGTGMAVRIAQRALRFLGEDIQVDGKIGPRTIEKLNAWSKRDPESLHKALNGYQFARYAAIIEADASQAKFGRGWLRRIQGYRRGA